LFSGEERNDISFQLLDSRNNGRIRYQRVNEETGEEVPWDQIVKGYEYDGKGYVLLNDTDFERASVEVTKRVEIEDFVDLDEIGTVYFEKPYVMEPGKGGEKSYALLRETLRATNKVGIAKVVIRSRQHLCAVMPQGELLLLEILRFPVELRDLSAFSAPAADSIKISQREIDMATQLVQAMTSKWEPDKYNDEYRDALMDYVRKKVEAGDLSAGAVPPESGDVPESEPPERVVDLMDYLKKSLERAKGTGKEAPAPKAAAEGSPGRKKPARKRAKPAARRERQSA
jgi:DNA end-binding protein Ku